MAGENYYPNADNYQQTSFPQPVPAPDVEPDEGSLLIVGYNPFWTEVLMASVDQLLQYGTWAGDNAAKMLAVNRAETLKMLLQKPISVEEDLPTPYWDDATDVDDEAPAETQTWYGYVDDPEAPAGEMTFFEDAAIWAFTGFLALTGTPAAAILFHTIAPSFVLAMRGDDFGEVIRVIVDGYDAATVDTAGSDGAVIKVPIFASPDVSPHEVLIVRGA